MTVALDARPRLHAKARLRVDAHSGQMMLLYPERGLQLNPTGREVLELCTGAATVSEIAAVLSARHGASTDVVLAEVRTFLDGLAERGLLAGLDEVAR